MRLLALSRKSGPSILGTTHHSPLTDWEGMGGDGLPGV